MPDQLEPDATIPWRYGRSIWLYIHPWVAKEGVAPDIIRGVTEAANGGYESTDLLRDAIKARVEEFGAVVLAFVTKPDHADPLGTRITVGVGTTLAEWKGPDTDKV
jgi:hypothetical protein